MKLIEQLGGYCKARKSLDLPRYSWYDELVEELLQYRRENGIFEIGDLVVGLNSETDEIFEIETISNKLNRKGEKTYATTFVDKEGLLCGLKFRHATDEEIKIGRRL